MTPRALDIRAFVPATDFALAKRFYTDLGFELGWADESLAYLRLGERGFLLQAFKASGFIDNFQLHLLVEDVDAWHRHVSAVAAAGGYAVRIGAVQDQAWQMRDFTLFDTSGVLWRIAQRAEGR